MDGKQKVSVGVTSAAGYGVTLAAVVAAALDYIGGDHSQPTKTTLILGVVAGVSFVTTQVGRYAQAKAQITASMYAMPEAPEPVDQTEERPSWLDEKVAAHPTGASVNAESQVQWDQDQAAQEEGWARTNTLDKVAVLSDAELEHDPEMGEPLDATPQSYRGDPKDTHGAEDHPA